MIRWIDDKLTGLSLNIAISASPKIVFEAWMIQGDLESVGFENAIFCNSEGVERKKGELVKQGDRFSWSWYTWPDDVTNGIVSEVVENKQITYKLTDAGKVTIQIEPHDDMTLLILTHSDLNGNGNNYYESFDCWINFWFFELVNLKAFLEHGIWLHEVEPMDSTYKQNEFVST